MNQYNRKMYCYKVHLPIESVNFVTLVEAHLYTTISFYCFFDFFHWYGDQKNVRKTQFFWTSVLPFPAKIELFWETPS